ncbi:phenylalanine racemase [filamentous cyanobacterium CCP5]|nr:phenylalanine racemase [filamentous cyanobacterium CCP5]
MISLNSDMHFEGIHTWFEQQAACTPDAPAVVSGNVQYSYRELNCQANQLARYLLKLGVRPETLVGICIERSPMMVVALLAILKAGGAYIPIDPDYPRELVALMIEDSQSPIVITQQHYASNLPVGNATVVCLDKDGPAISEESSDNLNLTLGARNLAYVIYTSGSTGRPKGVLIEHQSLINFVRAAGQNYQFTRDDRVLQFASVSFDISVEEIFVTLTHGATLVLRSQEMIRSAAKFLSLCQDWKISVIDLPTAFWHKICAELPDLQFPEFLRLVVIGGERAVPHWLEIWKQHSPAHVRLVNTYGPTEATVVTTTCDLAGPNPATAGQSRILPIGKPIENVQTHILTSDLEPVTSGMIGELYIAGAGLARGYLNRPDLTAIKYIQKSFGDAGIIRLYKTGDRARYRKDGHLEFLGRIDSQEKIRGFRVELNEIETVLERHSAVRQSIVLAREDLPGNKRLVAYVVPNAATLPPNLSYQSRLVPLLRSYLQEKLPSYMVPTSFVLLSNLPLSANGKVNRRALPAPTADRPVLESDYVAPRTPLESELVNLWSTVLGIAEIGVNDNFFELGGDSLQTMEIVADVEKTYSVDIQLKDFLRIPSIAGLAVLIKQVLADEKMPDEYMSLQQMYAEVQLSDSIQPQSTNPAEPRTKSDIFLTGGTGFLGKFLLCELLRQTHSNIYCLVRGQSASEAQQKLHTAIAAYFTETNQYYSRIIPVVGNLMQPMLGLSESQFQALADSVGSIYHCGAQVNLLYPYTALKSANVKGTHEVLKLASMGLPKKVHHVSTLDVFESLAGAQVRIFHEEDDIAQGTGIFSGYAQSKWIAEQMVSQAAERGLPVSIYRPGMITGHSQRGDSNTRDIFCRFIKTLIQLKKAPDIALKIDMTPVDYVSQTIARLSLQPESAGSKFHIVNPRSILLDQVVRELASHGYDIQTVPAPKWFQALHAEPNDFQALAAFITDATEEDQMKCLELWLGGNYVFDCANTNKGLASQGITCPPADQQLLRTCLKHLIQTGFLPTYTQPMAFLDGLAG